MGPKKVHEVMTERPRCVTPDTPVSEAARLMESEDVGALPILDGDQLTGMVTDRDIVVRAVARERPERYAGPSGGERGSHHAPSRR